jgi:TolA-binding protein
MSQSHPSRQDCTDLTTIVEQLAERVTDLEETVEDQQATIEDLEQEKADLEDRVADLEAETARSRAEDRQRLTDLEETVEDLEKTVEEGDITDENPTPETDTNASTEPLTPIERLSEGDHADIATNVTASVRRAVTLFDHLPAWGQSTPKGRVLKPADRPKQLLEAATDESLAWTQYYRAAEALERLSKGAVTFFDHQKHGKTVVLHGDTDVHDRAVQSETNRSQSLSVAD